MTSPKYNFGKGLKKKEANKLPRITQKFKRYFEVELTDVEFYLRDFYEMLKKMEKDITNNDNSQSQQSIETLLIQNEHLLMKVESLTKQLELTEVVYDTSFNKNRE